MPPDLNYRPKGPVYARQDNGYWFVLEFDGPRLGYKRRAVKLIKIDPRKPEQAAEEAAATVAAINKEFGE